MKLTVEECFAFDYLSILQLKCEFAPDNKQIKKQYGVCYNDICNGVTCSKADRILNSEEYAALLEANRVSFKAVDDAKTDKVTASYVDRKNYDRYLCKQRLQQKFFQTDPTEVKLGYEGIK